MAGRIRDEDIALVRERTSIAEIISDTVTLKSAGAGNLKGLCPFHDEKSPSFNVSPVRNVWYCFGCGEGGDAIKFLMDAEHLSFVEAVERLADRAGLQLRYVEDDRAAGRSRPQQGQKQRLVAAHAAAVEFYTAQLTTAGARTAREFLAERGFDRAAAERYGCGFAPEGWDPLTRAPAAARVQPRRAGDRRAVPAGPLGQPDRPVPAPAALADPRPDRRRDRLRCPQAVRRR